MAECTREFFILDGALKPIAAFDDCFQNPSRYIYEVFRVQSQVPVFVEDHIERLWETAAIEGIELPFTQEEILTDILKLISANPHGDGNIKIFISKTSVNTISRVVYFTPHQYPTASQYKKGVAVTLYHAERKNPNAKVMDVSLRKATQQVKDSEEIYEVLLVDGNGFITEGSRSNVFFVKNEKLITPPVHQVLEGITRKHIMQLCEANGITLIQLPVHHTRLKQMDAVFITGTSRRVLPVQKLDNIQFNPFHPLIRKLQNLMEEKVSNYIEKV